MGFWSSLKSVASKAGNAIVEGVVTAADCTLQFCEDVATVTADGCRWVRDKIKKWRTPPDHSLPPPPPDPVHPSAKKADEPMIDNAIHLISGHFSAGVVETAIHSDPEERKKKIEELVPKAARAMGVKNPPKLEFFVPDKIEQLHSLCGGYRRTDNTLRLNLAMIVSNNPELFHEQVSTVFHELLHTRQYEAISAFAEGKPYEEYGYSADYIQIMAENMLNYITPDENPEAYSKQPIEAEAFWFEQHIKPYFN